LKLNNFDWKKSKLLFEVTLKEVIENLTSVAIKIVLIVDKNGKLIGTVSDGDVRRGLLKGLTLASPVLEIVNQQPLVAPPGLSNNLIMQLMLANKIQQIPIVNERHEIEGLYIWDEIVGPSTRSNQVVIMAGGKGSRLRPHTENCPKPMLNIKGKPILEHIIERSKSEGFTNYLISIHYLGNVIEDYFGNGDKWAVNIKYLKENTPLGTAGALSFINPLPSNPIIVINGDVLTDIKYGDMLNFHLLHHSSATMAVRTHEWQHPFGVIQTNGVNIIGFEEKPISRSQINAGVYILDPFAIKQLSLNEYCDMPMLFERIMSLNKKTIAYPMHELWLDIGRPEDLLLANRGYFAN
jgi:dTDP-glucose pyrophosphorylase